MPHRGGPPMGTLTDDMKRVVSEQKLGFCATVCPDGSPNLSPKGSTGVWDDDHLFFADICSPQTTANLRAGSLIAVNVVDPFKRKGYRFKGRAVICEPGSAEALISPVYDDGTVTEADVLRTHRKRFASLHERRAPARPPLRRCYPDSRNFPTGSVTR